jgi:diguanylate cyclase (GGDEF)-like protein
MKTINILFKTISELSTNIKQQELSDSEKLLIQLFVEIPDKEYINALLSSLREQFPLAKLIGATSDGIISENEVYVETKNLISFSYFEDTTLSLASVEYPKEKKNSFESGRSIAKELCNESTKLLISFADGLYTNGEDYLHGIADINPNVIVAGGMAGDNGKLVQTYVFTKDGIISPGIVAVALAGEKLNVESGYTFDWKPIGKMMKVTRAIKNRVYELDNMPLIEIYAKYMGRELANALPQIGIEFPLVLEKDGVLIGRAPIARHDDGSLTFAGNIEEGIEVRFGVGNVNEILRSGNYEIHKLVSRAEYEVESIFIYSCMARRRFMQKQILDELKFLSTVATTSGFFTYGEFFHSTSNQLLNETMTMVLLSESSNSSKEFFEIESSTKEFKITNEQILAHLANIVSSELEELNHNLEERIKESASLIHKQAYTDKLTGLPNRLSLIDRLKESIGKTIILINVDDFTIINDFYGHAIGDSILIQLAQLLEKYTKIHKMELFKLPSDEYAVIVDVPHQEEQLRAVMRDFLTVIKYKKFTVQESEIGLTVTIAAAFINKKGSGLINSDMALKLAKKAGKSSMIYDDDLKLSQEYAKNISIAKLVKGAIEEDRIVPYFQPIYNIKTMQIEKYEALIRLIKEDGEVLTPYFFLEIAQKIKLYPKLTHIMIDKTFKYFANNGLNFSINLAFTDILNENTRNYLFRKIAECKIAKQLTIEILETQELENDGVMLDFIDAIYDIGARIAIDDFGSGFANFEHMTKNRSDFMKIDGSLIKNIDRDENARLVVETIVEFAKKLRKKTVAEFVHSAEIFELVKDMGVDYVQGYYLSEPLPEIISPE